MQATMIKTVKTLTVVQIDEISAMMPITKNQIIAPRQSPKPTTDVTVALERVLIFAEVYRLE